MNPAETVKDWTARTKQFYVDVRNEMKKVSWPNRQEVISTTIVVVAAVFFFGVYLGLVDRFLGFGLAWVIRYFGGGG